METMATITVYLVDETTRYVARAYDEKGVYIDESHADYRGFALHPWHRVESVAVALERDELFSDYDI